MNKYIFLLPILWFYTSGVFAQEDTTRIQNRVNVSLNDGEIRQDTSLVYNKDVLLISPDYNVDRLNLKPEKSGRTAFRNHPLKPFILPAGLITYGIVAQYAKPLEKIDNAFNRNVNDRFDGKWEFDDYTQLAPSVAVYGLELFGLKPKHSFLDRTFVMLVAHGMMLGVVRGSKHLVNVKRPSGITGDSFPSGHTATSFTGAHILFKEYKDVSPWIPVAGYTVACLTGTMRMVNGMHWFSDVVAGAGVGILSAEVAYLLLPAFQRTCKSMRDRRLVIMPEVGPGHYGAGMAFTF